MRDSTILSTRTLLLFGSIVLVLLSQGASAQTQTPSPSPSPTGVNEDGLFDLIFSFTGGLNWISVVIIVLIVCSCCCCCCVGYRHQQARLETPRAEAMQLQTIIVRDSTTLTPDGFGPTTSEFTDPLPKYEPPPPPYELQPPSSPPPVLLAAHVSPAHVGTGHV